MQNINLTIDQLLERWGQITDEAGVVIKRGGATKGTLAVWRSEGSGPSYFKVGKNVLYPLDEVAKYEKENFTDTAPGS